MVLGAVFALLAFSFGLHRCDAGYPPPQLSIFLAVVLAVGVTVAHKSVGWGALIAAILWAGGTPMSLASAYHRPGITGNPQYASGAYWHTFVTGAMPKRTDDR